MPSLKQFKKMSFDLSIARNFSINSVHFDRNKVHFDRNRVHFGRVHFGRSVNLLQNR